MSKVDAPWNVVGTFATGLGHSRDGLAFDAAGNLYMADGTRRHGAARSHPRWRSITPFASGFSATPKGLAFDVGWQPLCRRVRERRHREVRCHADGNSNTGLFASGFAYPGSVMAFDAAGNLYVG